MKRASVIHRVPRRWAALFLVATWSIGGGWDVSHAAEHAFEHTDSEHHATLHDECLTTSEVTASGSGHGHAHPHGDSVVSTMRPRFESAAAVTSAARKPRAPLLSCAPQVDPAVSARASPSASGPTGPRAPPLS